MTIWIKITIGVVVVWVVGMMIAASVLEEAGIEPDRPGHEINCVENQTC